MKHILFLFLFLSKVAASQKMMLFHNAAVPSPPIDNQINLWNSGQLGFNNLNSEEQKFYYWINYSRANPRRFFDSAVAPVVAVYPQLKGENYNSLQTDLYNSAALPALMLNPDLIKMAKAHSSDIVSHNAEPSHYSTNGNSFSERFKSHNLKNCGAENISYGSGDPMFLVILLYLDINVPDLGHRKTLLNPSYTETGIGASTFKNGSIFIVEDFACTQN